MLMPWTIRIKSYYFPASPGTGGPRNLTCETFPFRRRRRRRYFSASRANNEGAARNYRQLGRAQLSQFISGVGDLARTHI
jgi:hypothetical protein